MLFQCIMCHNLNDMSVNVFKQEISYCMLVIIGTSTAPFVTSACHYCQLLFSLVGAVITILTVVTVL